MKIEWWMLDGGICIIILISVILGIARGIGDTLLRLAGMIGGLVLAFFYSDKVTAWLSGTSLRKTVYDHLFQIIRGTGVAESAEESEKSSSALIQSLGEQQTDPYTESVPKAMSGAVTDLANKAAGEAADRFTEIILSLLGFLLIVLAVWLIVTLIRYIYRSSKKKSVLLGFTDRALGMTLGLVKGLLAAFIAAAVLIPAVTIIAPSALPDVLEAMDQTYIARVIYDVNPLLLIIQGIGIIK